jgi:hypothetical protein
LDVVTVCLVSALENIDAANFPGLAKYHSTYHNMPTLFLCICMLSFGLFLDVGYQGLIALINDATVFMVVCRTPIQLEWGDLIVPLGVHRTLMLLIYLVQLNITVSVIILRIYLFLFLIALSAS